MSQIWGMINGLQLFVHVPMFKVEFPEMANALVKKTITVATFDVLPTDDIYAATTTRPEEPEYLYLEEDA